MQAESQQAAVTKLRAGRATSLPAGEGGSWERSWHSSRGDLPHAEVAKLQRQDSALPRVEAAYRHAKARKDIERDNTALQEGKQG